MRKACESNKPARRRAGARKARSRYAEQPPRTQSSSSLAMILDLDWVERPASLAMDSLHLRTSSVHSTVSVLEIAAVICKSRARRK